MNSVDICNQALVSLGMNPIVTLDSSDNSAVRCKNLFPVCRDRMLRDHVWSFAVKSATCQKAAETSARTDYPIVSVLPVDCIRVVRLTSGNPYLLRGRKLLLTSAPDTLEYVSRVTNAEYFDPAFADALASLIACELALYGTRDGSVLQYHREQYMRKISAAKAIDSIENIHDHQRGGRVSAFLDSRR